MYCGQCGKKNPSDSQFCISCGEKLISANDQGSVKTEEAQVKGASNLMGILKQLNNKVGSRNLKLGGIVAGVLIIVLILSSVIGSGGSGKVLGIIYDKDEELYITSNDKAGERFSFDEYRWRGASGEKGEYIYFLEDYDYDSQEGALRLKRLGKDTMEIEDDVYEYYKVSPSGKRILFLTDFDGEVGDLYLSVDGKESERIAKDVATTGFVFGEDESEVAYVEDFDKDDYTGTLYYKKEGKEAQEVDDEATFPLLLKKGGKEIYFAKEYDYYAESFDLYLKSGKNDIERLSKGITSIVYNKDFTKSIEMSTDDDWNMTFELRKNNKDTERIDKKITDVYYIASISEDTISYYQNYYNDSKFIHADKNQDLFTIYAEDNDKVYIYKEGYDPVELIDYTDLKHVTTDINCNVIAYIDTDDNTLYTTTFKRGELTEPVEIDDDVHSITLTENGKNVVYIKDYKNGEGELFVAKINGEPEAIADDVTTSFKVSDDGKEFVFIDEDETLFYVRRGKDKQKIAEDVSRFDTSNFKTLYYVDYDEELFKVNIGKDPISIDDDVNYFILIGDLYN